MEEEVSYLEMYLKMARAVEEAIRILIRAQEECEEYYMEMPERAIHPTFTVRDAAYPLRVQSASHGTTDK